MKTISFEFFPPKDEITKLNLEKSAEKLSICNPDFFSVTYGAAGTTKQGTLETVFNLKKLTSIATYPHLSCIDSTKQEMEVLLKKYLDMGITRIVALRGDKSLAIKSNHEFNFAVDLIKLIRKNTFDDFHITVAAYPEMHPEAQHGVQDFNYFRAKVAAGANSAITQFFYNADAYFYFLDRCAKHQMNIPIIPGIMPIYNLEKLQKFSKFCGAEIPRWIIKQLMAYESDSDAAKQFSLEVVYNLCEKLLQRGAPGLHFYTLNQANTCLQLCRWLGYGTI